MLDHTPTEGAGAVILDWPDCTNVRDLGGLHTTDGRRIRGDALLRSDHLGRLTAEAVAALRAGSVRRIVDLRWAKECAERPSPFADDPLYVHTPMLIDDPYEFDPDSYAQLLDLNRPLIGAAVRAVADAPPGGVLVHCHEGKDRTGVLVALLLLAAGVTEEQVVADYALTAGVDPKLMVNTLEHLHQAYAGIEPYL